ncbi:MAG: hypothetical protein ACI4B5_01480 [Bacteroidaceae bacterium]
MSRLSASPDVLTSIRKQKRKLRQEIVASQALIKDSAHALVSPVTHISRKGHSVSKFVSRGVAIFEGIRIGLRIIRATRSLFGKRKRR